MSGVDLIKRTNPMLDSGEPIGITTPLFSIAGKKMGKSEDNAIWLSPQRTAPFDFYYYFYTVSDEEAGRLLRLFTAVHEEEVEAIMGEHAKDYSKRTLQVALASKLCSIVHFPQTSKELCEVAEQLSGPNPSLSENLHGHVDHLVVNLEGPISSFKEFLIQCFPEIPRRKNYFIHNLRRDQ